MTQNHALLLAVGGLAVVCLALALAVIRVSIGTRRTAEAVAVLRARVHELEADDAGVAESQAPTSTPVEFVITDLGRPKPLAGPEPLAGPAPLDRSAFADIVLRETVVKAASLVHGVRRGIAPETRNRIRFEMRQEVRRSRKQRRADLKAAQRDRHARQRAGLAREAS